MKGLNRKNAISPLSASWTLYKPEKLAEKLSLPVDVVSEALEQNGFYKATRIREELIRWKVNLLAEVGILTKRRKYLDEMSARVRKREREIAEQLLNIRNILRLPREAKD